MADMLRLDHINSLPQPFTARLAGDKIWWPIYDIAVDIGLCRIDVCGRIEVRAFAEIMEIRDGDSAPHDPTDWYMEARDG